MDDILHQANGGPDRRRGERQREADMPRVVHAVIRIPQEDGSSRTTAISRWTRPGNPSGGGLIVMSSSPGTSSNSRESMRSSFLSHFKSRDCSSLWRENEVESSDSGDSDYDEDDDVVVAESANRSKAAKNWSRSISAGTTPRVAENRLESSKLAKILSSSEAETAELCVVKKERGHDLSDGFERSSVESGFSGWSDCHESGSELEEEYQKQRMFADSYGFEAHKCSRKYKSATEFHNVCAALKRGLLNNKALDWSAITTRRQKEPPGSGAEGFPTSSSACMREVADKDSVLEKQNIVGMSKGERTVSVEVGEGRRDRETWRQALESFRSKYKCSPARHLLYRIIYKAPKPVDEQERKMQNDVKLKTEELEDQEKPRKGRGNLDAGSTFEKLGPELAQELVENKRVEREAELQSLARHGSGAGLEEFDEEIGLCRGLTADRCSNGSRSIKESSRRIELSCSEGCCVLFHFQACWREFEKNFRDNNTDWKMVRGAICMTPDCPGKLIKVQTRESKQVIHELVEEVKKEKKPAIHRDLPFSHCKKLVKTAKLKSKEARSTSAEIAEQSQILIVHPSSSESFGRRGCIEPATLSNASTSNAAPICDLLPISTSAEIAEQAKILRVDSSSSKSFEKVGCIESATLSNASTFSVAPICDIFLEKDKEFSAAGEGSAMLAVVPEGPLQVYKKKNDIMAVSKEPKRKLKMKKSKSKGKKVHLFRDGFTLPSAEEQEEDSSPGFFGMTHDYWSDQVLSPLISEPSATQFPSLSVGESSVMTNPKSSAFSPLAVLKAQSLLVDPEHQESVRSPHLLIENVHPEADYAEMRDLFAQGGSMVQLDLFPFYHIATVSMGSWEEAVIARGLNNDTSVRGMKLKCTYFLKERLQPDLFSNVPDDYLHANELEGGTLQPDEPAHTHGSVQPGSPLPAPTVESAITMEHASTLTCTPTESQESGALPDPTPTFNSLTMSTALAPTLPHHISLESHGTNFQPVPMLESISMSPIVTMPHGSDSSSAQLTQNVEVLKSTFINSSGTPLRVTARPFVVGEYSARCLRSSEESSVVTSETLVVGSMSSELSDMDLAAASDAIPPVSLLIDSRGVNNSSIAPSSLTSSHESGTSLVRMKSFNLATDGTDENRIPQYPTVHDYEYLISPDFHQLSFPKTDNPDAYYSSSMSEPNWRPTSIECSLTSMPSSVFPPLDYGTPSLSCSVSPVQENETPSCFFGQVIGCNDETLAMYKQMSRFCVSTKHLLAVPHIAPGTCILFLYNILTQQTYGVYQSSSYGMKPMVGSMMESMVVYAPSVGFDTLHDYPVSITGAELESVLPGATQMSGRSLYLSFSQMKQVLSIFRLKNMAQTCSIDSGPYPDISETELLNLTSEGRVSPPASLNLTTSSLDNAAPPSPLCISFAGKFQGEELCSPKASTLKSELGLEPDSRVLDTVPPPAKGTPQLSPMELFPHLFPKAIVADQQEKAHDMSFEPVQPNPSEPQFRSSSVYNPLMMDTVLQHATPVTESVSQFLLPHPKLGYNPLAFEQDQEKQQLEVEMSNKERSFASRQVSKECFLGLSTGSAESLIRTQEAIEMQVSSTSGVPTASLLFPYFYEVATPISDVTVPGLELASSSSAFSASSNVEVHSGAILTDSVTIKQTEPNLQKHAHLCCYCYARPPDHLILDCRHLGPCLDCKNTRSVEICGQPNCGTWVTKMLRIHL